jgi:hypothetical protein
MAKRIILAIVAIFVVWSVSDFIIHGLILGPTYEVTQELWRPMNEMKMVVLYSTVLIAAIAFVCIYARFVTESGVGIGILYGLLFGITVGVPMGFGTYSVMPIPFSMAATWCLGSIAEYVLGGIIVGWIVKE